MEKNILITGGCGFVGSNLVSNVGILSLQATQAGGNYNINLLAGGNGNIDVGTDSDGDMIRTMLIKMTGLMTMMMV